MESEIQVQSIIENLKIQIHACTKFCKLLDSATVQVLDIDSFGYDLLKKQLTQSNGKSEGNHAHEKVLTWSYTKPEVIISWK